MKIYVSFFLNCLKKAIVFFYLRHPPRKNAEMSPFRNFLKEILAKNLAG